MQYHFRTFGEAMYAPCARSSLASVRSTRLRRDVTFFALSRGTVCPQLVHWTTPDDPLPPFLRPLLALFSGILYGAAAARPLILCMPARRDRVQPPMALARSSMPSNRAEHLDLSPCPARSAARRGQPRPGGPLLRDGGRACIAPGARVRDRDVRRSGPLARLSPQGGIAGRLRLRPLHRNFDPRRRLGTALRGDSACAGRGTAPALPWPPLLPRSAPYITLPRRHSVPRTLGLSAPPAQACAGHDLRRTAGPAALAAG